MWQSGRRGGLGTRRLETASFQTLMRTVQQKHYNPKNPNLYKCTKINRLKTTWGFIWKCPVAVDLTVYGNNLDQSPSADFVECNPQQTWGRTLCFWIRLWRHCLSVSTTATVSIKDSWLVIINMVISLIAITIPESLTCKIITRKWSLSSSCSAGLLRCLMLYCYRITV